MRYGWALLLWSIALPVAADVLCLERATGKILEYQAPGTPGICTQNLIAAGWHAHEIEERSVTAAEWEALNEAQVRQPLREAKAARQAQALAKRQAAQVRVQAKLGLTDKEWDDLKEALRE